MKLTTRQLRRIIAEEAARIVEDAGTVDKELGEYIDAWKEDVRGVAMDDQTPASAVVDKVADELMSRIQGIAANYEEKARGSEMSRRQNRDAGPASSRRPGVKESKTISALKQFIRETVASA